MYVTFLRKRWKLVYRYLKEGEDGYCESPERRNKKIVIEKKLKGLNRLEAEIHEMLHAGDWTKDEEWIHDFGHDLAKALYRIGYRLPEDRED